jgi:hypothetical protein
MVFVVAVATVVLLAGCVGPAPTPTPTEAVSEPVFASEEEALAAAEEVFAKYVEASTKMATSGGTDLSGFDGLVTSRLLAEETQSGQDLHGRGEHLQGAFGYSGFSLQQFDQSDPQQVFLQAYACLDLSNVAYVNSSGEVVSDPASASAPLDVVMTTTSSAPTKFLVERADKWTGVDFCE